LTRTIVSAIAVLIPQLLDLLGGESSESPTHGEQEGSAWNGHFGCTCYHPLFVFNQYGDQERCLLRAGQLLLTFQKNGAGPVSMPVTVSRWAIGC
jgi:Transposase DDE domain group 1